MISVLISAFLMAQNCGQELKDWRECQISRDCVVAEDACGYKTGYSKKSFRMALKFNQCIAPQIDCAQPPKNKNRYRPRCVKNRCEAELVSKKQEVTKESQLPRSCTQHSDCTLANIFNCCRGNPIRKDRVNDYEKVMKQLSYKMCSQVNCILVQEWPVCLKGRCESSSKKP